MHPRRWAAFNAAVDSTGRPLVLPASGGPMNAEGIKANGNAQGVVGALQGVDVVIDSQIPTNLGAGTNQDAVIVMRAADQILWEGSLKAEAFRETKADQLSVLCEYSITPRSRAACRVRSRSSRVPVSSRRPTEADSSAGGVHVTPTVLRAWRSGSEGARGWPKGPSCDRACAASRSPPRIPASRRCCPGVPCELVEDDSVADWFSTLSPEHQRQLVRTLPEPLSGDLRQAVFNARGTLPESGRLQPSEVVWLSEAGFAGRYADLDRQVVAAATDSGPGITLVERTDLELRWRVAGHEFEFLFDHMP
jgi:hypothetical protein